MFRRRTNRTWRQRLREAVWPSMGMLRLANYYRHRVGRLKETPYAIAAGFASGVAISFTPFMGFHLMMGGVITWICGGSLMAMVLGTVVAGNPWTFPVIWITTYKLGKEILGETPHVNRVPAQFTVTDLMQKPMELLLPMALGSLPFFILSWLVTFYAVRHVVAGYREKRRKRIHGD